MFTYTIKRAPLSNIVLFTPATDKARTFASESIGLESWQWLGKSFVVDARLARDLIQRLRLEGFTVEPD